MTSASIAGRDRRGGWRPPHPHEFPPLYAWPPRPAAVFRWLFGFPGYLWPVNGTFLVIALVTWFFLTPDVAVVRSFEPGWIALVFLRNLALTVLLYGGLHLYLHVFRCQGTDFQLDTRPFATRNPAFLFGDQVRDNMFWTLASGVTVWTAYEVATLWAFANELLPFAHSGGSSLWFVALLVLTPFIHHLHFDFTHRLLHWRPIYRSVHYLHHRNVNTGPWSGLAMHPVEHLVFFSAVLIQWLVALHPVHALFQLQVAAFGPALGHCGFGRIRFGRGKGLTLASNFHSVHHRRFKYNYGGSLVPLDKWLGTYHDDSDPALTRVERQASSNCRSARSAAVQQGSRARTPVA